MRCPAALPNIPRALSAPLPAPLADHLSPMANAMAAGAAWLRTGASLGAKCCAARRARAIRSLAIVLGLWLQPPAPVIAAPVDADGIQVIDQALAVGSTEAPIAQNSQARRVTLPDDWASSWPHHSGSVWYRTSFDRPDGAGAQAMTALYIDRACSSVEVYLNGQKVHSTGRAEDPPGRHCHYPQLVSLPTALLQDRGNQLDLQVRGQALQRVAGRQRAGGLSALRIGPQAVLEPLYERRLFWRVTAVQGVNLVLATIGLVLIGLGGMNRRESHLWDFGWLTVVWSLLSARLWWRDPPWDAAVMEFLFCAGFAPLVALVMRFLLGFADRRSRRIDAALTAQWILMPVSLILAGPGHLFSVANAWYLLFGLELAAAMACLLWAGWHRWPAHFAALAAVLAGAGASLAWDLTGHFGLTRQAPVSMLQFTVPLLLLVVAARLLYLFGGALREAELGRLALEARIQDITTETERNFAQVAELRVEQVTERERKRIAGDLHDDLGAKLLTIVHTSESERISALAREALEEMRLSVRGLTGKPMRLDDALADWRAEIVLRLGQANIEADWRNPADDVEQELPARSYVQTTRILREAVSNIIKHSGASHCKVRCAISEHQFGLTVQDNGKGIPLELDGKLDRGHGMSSMKHRAKQMQGQCLVESAPGYGTVIRLTLPL